MLYIRFLEFRLILFLICKLNVILIWRYLIFFLGVEIVCIGVLMV